MDGIPFGEWLKRQRSGRGLTQEQLAQKIGCATITLRKIESEQRRPSAQIIERMAEIFNIPQNEKIAFSRFARGVGSAPAIKSEAAPWSASPTTSRSNLPASLTSFIGREQDIASVCEYLVNPDIRIVTLIGPPGIGKTRLCLAAAHETLPDFTDGTFFVALAPLENSSVVAPTILETLNLVESELKSPLDRLKDGIGNKDMLLVLDNLEHIIDGSALLVSDLLSACPRLKILTTSREALRVPGEWLYSVPVLNIPQKDQLQSMDMEETSRYAALSLFAERARAVKTDFVLNSENIQAVAAICTQLDGLPLAIELIAARIRLMSPQALLAKLNDQFVLSADGMRAVPARQKTLHNAISWSYNLLSTDEQNLFARLSVFSGGFTLDAAESMFAQIASDKRVSDLIALLLNKSLLHRVPDVKKSNEPRFGMLVTIQKFALECLQRMMEETNVRNWHIAYFLDLAHQADKKIPGPEQQTWLNYLDYEHNNYRAALEWCIHNQNAETALYLLDALSWAWLERERFNETQNWLAKIRTLPAIKEYPDKYAQLLNYTGLAYWLSSGFSLARSVLTESQAIWVTLGIHGESGLAENLYLMGIVARSSEAGSQTAHSFFEESQKLYQKHGDKWSMAFDMFNLDWFVGEHNKEPEMLSLGQGGLNLYQQLGYFWGIIGRVQVLGYFFLRRGSFEKARFFLNQQLKIDESLQSRQGTMVDLGNLGELYRYQGDYDQAEKCYKDSLAISREYGLKDGGFNFYGLALVALHQNNYKAASQHLIDYFGIAQNINEKFSRCDLLLGSAAIAAGTDQRQRAAKLYGAAQALFETVDYRIQQFDYTEFDRPLQTVKTELGIAAFESLATEGRAMPIEQAVAYALETNYT